MEPVITVNDVSVYSNKVLASVEGSRAYFTDGSWIDVSNGETHNVGHGYLSLTPDTGIQPGDKKKKTSLEKFAGINQLNIRDLSDVNLFIEIHQEPTVDVQIISNESRVGEFSINQRGSTLDIRGRSASQSEVSGVSFSGSFINISGSSLTIDGNKISFSRQSNPEDFAEVKIFVPQGTSLVLSNVGPETEVGDIDGDVDIRVDMSQRIKIGSVKNANLKANMSALIEVESVSGDNLSLDADMSATIKVLNGRVTNLDAESDMSAAILYLGHAVKASMKADMNASIHIKSVENIERKKTGMGGSIRIG